MDLISCMEIIYWCNKVAEVTVVPFNVAEQCSAYYEYTLTTYFAGDYDAFRLSYENFHNMFSQKQ
jgi:hypothetical protein